jgi:hypothetical protein
MHRRPRDRLPVVERQRRILIGPMAHRIRDEHVPRHDVKRVQDGQIEQAARLQSLDQPPSVPVVRRVYPAGIHERTSLTSR